MRRFAFLLLCLLGLTSPVHAQNAPHFYKATSIRGAVAYQSASDPTQFFYIPTETEQLLGDRLKEFRVSYYGVGEPYYIKNSKTGKVASSVGAVVSAIGIIDLSDATRKRLIAQIQNDFKIANPKLLPLPLSNTRLRSLLLDDALSVADLGQITSSNPQFGREVQFSAGAKDNLFAQLLATSDANTYAAVSPNPHFAVEIVGEAEFVGDPWQIEITCDLAQVWNQVRTSVSVSASLGWFTIGQANYQNLNQELEKSGACKYKEIPGSKIDRETNMLPLLEMTRRIFEQLNAAATAGQGFFKFEPNPDAPAVSAGGARSIWPWSVSVNAGYSAAHFTQHLTWSTTIEIGTRFNYPIAAVTSVAVTCSDKTKAMFQDLRDASENCITQRKIDRLMERLALEKTVVNRKLADLEQRLMAGTITVDIYNLLYKQWTTESQTEGALIVTTDKIQVLTAGKPGIAVEAVEGFSFAPRTTVDEDIAWARRQLEKTDNR